VAIVHEIIRKGAKDLTLSFQSSSICAELLAGAMLLYPDHLSIRRVEMAWWGYEVIGIAPLLRHLASDSMTQFDDYTNYGMSARFKAAAMGLEFIPVRDHGGSDMERVNRGKMVESPFTGKNTYEFRKSGNQDLLKKYYEEYIFGCETFGDFLNKIPQETFEKIKQLDGGQPIILD